MEETDEQFETRLLKVIANAETKIYKENYVWRRYNNKNSPSTDALACVSDNGIWYEFVPAKAAEKNDCFRVVRFNFAEKGPSAIGFVAWLHTHLRKHGRTGAIVICGKDKRLSRKLFNICQGAMDYWACPVGPASERFLGVIENLIDEGKALRQ